MPTTTKKTLLIRQSIILETLTFTHKQMLFEVTDKREKLSYYVKLHATQLGTQH